MISIDIKHCEAQERSDNLTRSIVFVDLETTGGNATHDRITEIGVVEVGPSGIESWSTLVDPGISISPAIEHLTGISNHMVRHQPSFREVAEALAQRLDGKLLVAHNARFDYGFLKNEFKRAGIRFKADTLCTVRLSRALFPRAERHGLDALIARLGLQTKGRHRALADADLLWQFWQKIHTLYPVDVVETAVKSLIRHASLTETPTPALPEGALGALAALPAGPGVYVLYGDNDLPLYVGKSDNLKRGITAHFSGDYRLAKEMRIAQQIRRIECRPTAGALGTLLLEAQLVKRLAPAHNRLLHRQTVLYAWQWPHHALRPLLVSSKTVDFAHTPGLYGAFTSKLKAGEVLRRLADAHQLCHFVLGLEKAHGSDGCSGYRIKRCPGCCVGEETSATHTQRAIQALDTLRLKTWPYAGPVALFEAANTVDDARYPRPDGLGMKVHDVACDKVHEMVHPVVGDPARDSARDPAHNFTHIAADAVGYDTSHGTSHGTSYDTAYNTTYDTSGATNETSAQPVDQLPTTTGQWHLIDNWCYLGSVEHQHQITAYLERTATVASFDHDIYAIVTRHQLAKELPVHQLATVSSFELSPPQAAEAGTKTPPRPSRGVTVKKAAHKTPTAIAQLAFDL